jgi:hypothetical protein
VNFLLGSCIHHPLRQSFYLSNLTIPGIALGQLACHFFEFLVVSCISLLIEGQDGQGLLEVGYGLGDIALFVVSYSFADFAHAADQTVPSAAKTLHHRPFPIPAYFHTTKSCLSEAACDAFDSHLAN